MEGKVIVSNRKIAGRNIIGWIPFMFVFLILISFYPYEFYSAYSLYNPARIRVIHLVLLLFTLGLLFVIPHKSVKLHPVLLTVVVCHFAWMLLDSVYKGKAIGIGVFVTPLLAIAMVFLLSSTCGLRSFFNKYNKWIFLMTVMGVLVFVLSRAGILTPLMSFTDLSDEDPMYNYGITFSQYTGSGFAYCGFFDEPGAIAQWSLFALIFNRLFVKNTKIEIPLILTTLVSLSMGYFIQIFVYILLFYFFVKKKEHKNGNRLFLIVLILGLVFAASTNEDIYDRSIGRLMSAIEDSKTQGLAVDDREAETLDALVEFTNNPLFGTSRDDLDIGHNIYEPLAMYGIIGTFFLYFPFLILLIRALAKKDIELLKCMIVIIVGFTHRPFHSNLLSFFIIYSFVALCFSSRIIEKKPKPALK